MELVAEFNPPRDPRRLVELAGRLQRVFDWIDIPDAPLGKPNYNSPVISAYLSALGYRVIAHLRVVDVNTIALKTITKTLGSLGVERIVYLRGDPPQQGSSVGDYTPEEAVYYARTRPEAPEPGLLLSLRRSIGEIRRRLGVPAGFYMLLNLDWRGWSNKGLLMEVAGEAHGMGKRVYAYLVMDDALCSNPRSIVDLATPASTLLDGIIVSAPHSFECVVDAGQALRESLG